MDKTLLSLSSFLLGGIYVDALHDATWFTAPATATSYLSSFYKRNYQQEPKVVFSTVLSSVLFGITGITLSRAWKMWKGEEKVTLMPTVAGAVAMTAYWWKIIPNWLKIVENKAKNVEYSVKMVVSGHFVALAALSALVTSLLTE